MGELTRAKDWAKTSVGPVETWPQSLRTTLGILLNSKFPMFLWWGPELVCFYNDAYRPSLGENGKHPFILGMKAEEAWPEIWGIIKPLIDQVLSGGEATWSEDQLIPIFRNGKLEDVYWTFSYSPVHDDTGNVGGVLVTCTETTDKINILNEIKEREGQLSFTIDAAELGTWNLNPVTNKFIGNERLKAWFGLNPKEEIDLSLALNVIVEKDRQKVITAIENALNPASGGNYNIEYTILNPATNIERRVLAKGKAVFNEQGEPMQFSGTLQDITQLVSAFKKIEERENEFRQLADSLPVLVWTTDPKGKQTFASSKWKEFTGLDPYDETTFNKMIHPDDMERIEKTWTNCLSTGEVYKAELRLKSKDDQYHWFYVNGEAIKNEKGKIEKWIGTFADISEQKRTEEYLIDAFHKIEKSDKRFRETVQQAPVGITILRGKKFIVEMANDAYLQLVDRKESSFVGKPLFESLPEVQESVYALLEDVLNTGTPFHGIEYPVPVNRYGKQELSYFDFLYHPLREEDGTISGIIVTVTDVSASVRAKHSLAESEKRFRSMVMHSPIPMTIFRGKDHIIEMANKEMFEKIWRKNEADVVGKKALEVFPELNDQKYPQLLKEVFTSGRVHSEREAVAYVRGDDGMQKFYLDFEYAPLYEADSSISGIIITVNDVTEKVEARLKVEESEKRLNIVIDASEHGTWDYNVKTGKIHYSERYLEIFGYKNMVELKHEDLVKQIHPDDLKVRAAAFETAYATGLLNYQLRIVWKDGSVHWIEAKGKVFYDEKGKPDHLIGTVRDITNERSRQHELQESEQKFRLLADSMPQFIWTGDAEGNLNYFNQSIYKYSGLTAELIEKDGWLQIVHPDEREENVKQWIESVTTGKGFIFEHRFRRSDGEYRWQLSRAIPQRDANGNIQMWVGTSTDIQEIKEQDQQKDFFISMASHELKTPITSIKGYVQILQSTYLNSEDVFLKNSLRIIDKQIITLTTLISDLLDVSKIKSGSLVLNKQQFRVNELVKEMIDEIKHVSPDYEIDFLEKEDIEIYADRQRIGQVIINFLTNAVKYSPNSRKINVGSVVEEGSIVISVADSGIGINKNEQERIFERFYRVEGKNEKTFPGFGIGLFIASEIIYRHNGKIAVNSEPGKGSVFYFSVPLLN